MKTAAVTKENPAPGRTGVRASLTGRRAGRVGRWIGILRRAGRDRVWSLVGIGMAAVAVAYAAGYAEAARGVLVGAPVGVLNHGLTRIAAGRWTKGAAAAAGWIMGASALRLVLAGGVLVWAAQKGPAFLIGILIGLLVDMLDYTLRLPGWLKRSRWR